MHGNAAKIDSRSHRFAAGNGFLAEAASRISLSRLSC